MEFKLICTESAPGQKTVESSITVVCFNSKDIDDAKQSICGFMDNKKVFRNTLPAAFMNLKPCSDGGYALKGAGRLIYFQTTDEGWDYSLYHASDTIDEDPPDGGVVTDTSLTAPDVALTLCEMYGLDPDDMTALTPSEDRAFFDL